PARCIRCASDDPARRAVRRASGRPLRPHRDVRGPGAGRQRHLGEPALRRQEAEVSADMTDYETIDFSPILALAGDEVITHSVVSDVRLGSGKVLALITLDNGRDH